MTVLVLTNCPPKLRGDLTKWFLEVNTNVYVGNINARVRDEIWERICSNVKSGRATMVFKADNEQKMDFRIHNTSWIPVDYDGIKLILHPKRQFQEGTSQTAIPDGFSKAAIFEKSKAMMRRKRFFLPSDYCVVDIETTGLDAAVDSIIEIGAIRIRNDQIKDKFQALIQTSAPITSKISELTGISKEDIDNGQPLRTVIDAFNTFIGDDDLVFHNAAFDIKFLNKEYRTCGISLFENRVHDTLLLAKTRVKNITDYKLETLAKWCGYDIKQCHRAIPDCHLTHGIYVKLKEL